MRASSTAGFISLVGLVALHGCGGGGDGGGSNPTPSPAFVTITSPDANSRITNCQSVTFSGKAFVSPTFFSCCTGNASDSGVTVRWTNETTGQSGTTIQRVVEISLVGIVDNNWSAEVPLAVGDNRVTITAFDPSGLKASETAIISHPVASHAISGTVKSTSGQVVSDSAANITLQLTGAATRSTSVSSQASGYGFACLLDGSYTVTPTSSDFTFPFSPTSKSVVIAGADVTNVDFDVTGSMLSGRVTSSSNGAGVGAQMVISGTPGTFKGFTSSAGDFQVLVPDGTFTLTPSAIPFSLPLTFSPTSRNVVVTGADISSLDFTTP